MTIGIYKLTFPNKKIYIGQSTNIENRFGGHRRDGMRCFNKNKKIKNITKLRGAYKKYQWNEVSYEIIDTCLLEELNDKEIYYVALYDSFKNGLNCTTGGNQNFKRSKETLIKLRLINLGKYGGVQAMPFYIDENRYVSILDASVKLHIPHKTIHNRLNSKNEKYSSYKYEDISRIPIRKKINNKGIKIKINNIIYNSASEASMQLNIAISTILRRAKSKSKKFYNYEIVD